MDEAVRVVGQDLLLQIRDALLKLLERRKIVPHQREQQIGKKIVRPVGIMRTHGADGVEAVRDHTVVIDDEHISLRPRKREAAGGLTAPRRDADMAGDAVLIGQERTQLRAVHAVRRERRRERIGQRDRGKLRRLEQSQYIFPFLRRFFAQRTKRVAKFIKLHNAAPLSYAYDSRAASPRQEIRF